MIKGGIVMIVPSDKDYKETKLIKQGKKELKTPFKELAEWINNKFEVKVINIYYDLINTQNRPRLNIIFEFPNDEIKFRTQPYGNYDSGKQKAIADKFKELIELINISNKGIFNDPVQKYKTDNLWIIFSSFEPIAKIEANELIPHEKINELKIKINSKELWEISRCFSSTTFFFYTDKQVRENTSNGMSQILTVEYYNLLKAYDEFDYIKIEYYSVYLDSKENFDNNYESNWYYYYK
jgi:hypothetical protein